MYNKYNARHGGNRANLETTLLKKRSELQGHRPNQERRSNLPHLEKTALGNILKNIGENSSSRTNYSSSNSVSHRPKLERYFDSSEPKFAGKSSHYTPPILNNNFESRRNSSDSGYNSSGKFCEPRTETSLSNGLQRVDFNDNKSCGKSDHGQFNGSSNSTTPSSGRSPSKTSPDFYNPKPRSYVNDRLTSPKSPMSESQGLVGLQNLGNTCFMNSILQCLSHCWPLRDRILSGGCLQHNKQSKMRGKLYQAFANLIKVMWSRNRTSSSLSPQSFKTEIQRFSPRFMGYEQQDSQEFLRFLLEGLNEDLNQAVCSARRSSTSQVSPDLNKLCEKDLGDEMWKQYLTKEDSLVIDLFCGQIMSTLTCTKCNNRSVTYDPFWDLSLSIPKRSCNYSRYTDSLSLSDCLKLFTKKEDLDGDEKPKCEKCKTRQKCEKQIKIHRFPKILVIHLKRFSGFGFRSKLQTDVDFPLNHLDMSKFASEYSKEISSEGSSGVKYSLFAVSNHSGSAFSGHYTAYCKHSESKQWHSFNDSRVTVLPSSSVPGSQAYVLFYEKDES